MTEKAMIPSDQATLPAIQEITLSPHEVIEIATEQANALMDIVEKKKLYVMIQNKKYLYYEAWETIGQFNGVKAIPDWVIPIKEQEETIGYTAKVDLLDKYGRLVGAGIMPCYFDEAPCRGKEGSGKHKAAMSAAQTFAGSKAYRMNFAYIAVLGGYEPTPAEEMITEVRSRKATSPLVDAGEQRGAVVIPEFPKLNAAYGVSLEFCWLHDNMDWKANKFGKLSHKTKDGWCNFSEVLKPITQKICTGKGITDPAQFTDWLKKNYEGKTWSKFTELEQCRILESLMMEE